MNHATLERSDSAQPAKRQKRLVILGAGFGGLNVAKALRDADLAITLIDQRNYHLFQPLLYQVATASLSPADIASPVRGILRRQKNVETLLARAEAIEANRRRVRLATGETIDYDFLVVATGVETSYFGNDAWEPIAPGLKDIDDAERIRAALFRAFEVAECEGTERGRVRPISVVIVGGGPTGVELAGSIAEVAHSTLPSDFRHVDPEATRTILVDAGYRVLSGFDPGLSEKARRDLQRLGVEIRSGTRVTNVQPGSVMLGTERLEADVVIWAAGVRPSPVVKTLDAPFDSSGRVLVEPDLSVPGHPEIFVIGDICVVHDRAGNPLPGIAPVAIQQAATAADNILRKAQQQPTRSFQYRDKGMLATIGRGRAVGMIRGLKLSGLMAWVIWAVVHIWSLIEFRNRLAVMLQWTWSYLSRQRPARLITGESRSARYTSAHRFGLSGPYKEASPGNGSTRD